MLEQIDSSAGPRIRFVFPSGEHEGELYTASLSFCRNPVCTCSTLDLTVVRDMPTDTDTSSPEYHFCVDIYQQSLDATDGETSEYDHNFSRIFVSYLEKQDWALLQKLFFLSKRYNTDKAQDEDLETHFPADEIDRNGAMVAFLEILPYAECRSVELSGKCYELDDQYCVLPKCDCSEIVVALLEEEEKESETILSGYSRILFDYKTGKWRLESRGKKSDAFFEQLVAELKSGDYRAWFEKRHSRLKSLYQIYKQRYVQTKPILSTEKVGRNEPCPCGSGKKYKKCCLGKE